MVCFLVAETTVPSLKGSDFQDVRTREIDSPHAAPIGIVVLLYSSMQVMNGFAMLMCKRALQDVVWADAAEIGMSTSRPTGEAKSSTNPQPKTMYVGTSVGLEDR